MPGREDGDEDILGTAEAGPAAVRGATLRVGGYVVATLLSVVSAAVLLRYLGRDRFGEYVAVFSLMTIVAGVTDAGTTNVGVREYAVGDPAARRHFIANLQGVRLTLGLVGALVAIAFAVLADYTDGMVLGTALAGVGLLLTAAALTLVIPLQAELRLGVVTALDLLRQAVTVVVLVALVVAGSGVALLLGAPIPVGIVLLAAAALAVRRSVPLRASFHPGEWRSLLADTLPYAAATAVGVIYGYLTVVLMSLETSAGETGLFGAAFRVFAVLAGIPGLLVASAFPVLARAARDDRERLRYGVQRIFDLNLVLATGLSLVTIAGAPIAILIVAGPDYEDAVSVLRIQGAALFCTFFAALGGFALLSLRRHRALLLANGAALVTSGALTLVLAPSLGAEGGAVANVAGEAVLIVGYWSALVRGDGLYPSLERVPRVLAAAAAGAVPWFLLGLPALPATLAGAAVFGAVALALRAVPPEATDAFRGRLGPALARARRRG